nr:right-handed parallel beta-helix repeat-containing protein [Fodinicola feengrottensis]
MLRAGVYRESVDGLGKPFILQPYPGEQAWISGADVVTGWVADGSTWRHDNWDVQLCHSCFLPNIIDPAYPQAGFPDMVLINGQPLRQVGSRDKVQAGTFFVDQSRHVLYVGTSPAGKTVESAVRTQFAVLDSGAAGAVIRGVGFRSFASNQDYKDHPAMVSVNARKVTFEKDVFLGSAATGLLIAQPDATISSSLFDRNGLAGIVANKADNIRIVGNTMVGNNAEHFAISGDSVGAAGTKITRTKRPYIARNIFRDNHSNGWWCDLGCSDAVVIGNLASGNQVNGLFYEISARALVASNVMAGNAKLGLKISSSDNVRVVNNTMVGNQSNLGVYNDPRGPDSDPYSNGMGQVWDSRNTRLLNNLMVGDVDSDQPFVITADYKNPPRTSAAQMIVASDGGCYVRANAHLPSVLVSWWNSPSDVDAYGSLAQWRQATGLEAHGQELTGGPGDVFVNPGALNFRPQPSSPAAHGGQPLPSEVASALGLTTTASPARGALGRAGRRLKFFRAFGWYEHHIAAAIARKGRRVGQLVGGQQVQRVVANSENQISGGVQVADHCSQPRHLFQHLHHDRGAGLGDPRPYRLQHLGLIALDVQLQQVHTVHKGRHADGRDRDRTSGRPVADALVSGRQISPSRRRILFLVRQRKLHRFRSVVTHHGGLHDVHIP